MDDPAVVRRLQPLGDLQRDLQRLVEGQRSRLELLRQRLPLGQLHDQEVHAVVVLDLVDAGDVGVVQRGQRLGLALEARQPLGRGGHRFGQHLQRDLAVELGVHGAIDRAHTSLTELRLDGEVQQLAAGFDSHASLLGVNRWQKSTSGMH